MDEAWLYKVMAWLVYFMIGYMFFMIARPYLDPLFQLFLMKRKNWVEKAPDAHIAIYRKRRKAAKHNIRGLKCKKVLLMGDENVSETAYGRLGGIIWKNEMAEMFVQPRRLRPWQWWLIPKELVRDPTSRVLRIKCNGVEPEGNFYKPVYCMDTVLQDRQVMAYSRNPGHAISITMPLPHYYNHLIAEYEQYLITQEKNIELEEQKANAMIEAVDVRRTAGTMIDRPEFAPKREGQPEEGKQYED